MSSRHLGRVARLAAVALAGFAVATPARAEVVKIGMVNSLTGPHSSFDLPASEGVAMALDEINTRGGITVKGRKYTFSLVSEDAQSKPEFAVSGAQRLLRDDDIKIVFGILTSGPGVPTATLLAKNDDPLFRRLHADGHAARQAGLRTGISHPGCRRHRRKILRSCRGEAARCEEGRHSAAERGRQPQHRRGLQAAAGAGWSQRADGRVFPARHLGLRAGAAQIPESGDGRPADRHQ